MAIVWPSTCEADRPFTPTSHFLSKLSHKVLTGLSYKLVFLASCFERAFLAQRTSGLRSLLLFIVEISSKFFGSFHWKWLHLWPNSERRRVRRYKMLPSPSSQSTALKTEHTRTHTHAHTRTYTHTHTRTHPTTQARTHAHTKWLANQANETYPQQSLFICDESFPDVNQWILHCKRTRK